MITLRHFCLEDAESVHCFLYPDMTLDGIAAMIGEWNSCVYQDRYFEMFAILCDGRTVGCVSLRGQNQSVASAGIEVFRTERKRGIATAAMAALIEFAAKKGYRMIWDQVSTDNQASIRLHEKLGFVSDRYVYRNQRSHEILLFIKPLCA